MDNIKIENMEQLNELLKQDELVILYFDTKS